uniref:ABC-type glutathione-S-conjugate transporter n=2 Tax=Schistocephalus solidus TaxID=70667 RepID=A0A0X3Q2S8_SCHSO
MSRWEVCSSGFINASLFWQPVPKFTPCFQWTVFSMPSVALIISSPVLFFSIKSRPHPVWRTVNLLKYLFEKILIMCLLVLNAFDILVKIIEDLLEPYFRDILAYLSPILIMISLILVLIIYEIQRSHGCVQSTTIFVFWIFLLLASIPRLYEASGQSIQNEFLLRKCQKVSAALFVAILSTIFFLQFFSSYVRPLRTSLVMTPFPEYWASVPSRLTFEWLTPLIWTAFRNKFEGAKDAFLMPLHVQASYNCRAFMDAWGYYAAGRRERIAPGELPTLDSLDYCSTTNGSTDADRQIQALNRNNNTNKDDNNTDNTSNKNDQNDPNRSPPSQPQMAAPTLTLCLTGDSEEMPHVEFSGAKKEVDRIHPKGRQYAFLLLKSLCRAFGPRLMVGWACLFIRVFTVYTSPLLLSALLRFLDNKSAYPAWYGYVLSSGFFVANFLSSFLFNQGFYVGFSTALSARSALMASIYRKTLKLSSESRGDYTAGQIVNFLTVDVDRLLEVMTYIHVTWTALIQFTVAVSLLWAQLGVSMLAGLAVMILFFPLNGIVMWLTQKFEAKEMVWKDERMKCLTETLSGIKIIKLYAWEEAFEKLVTQLRNSELRQLLLGSVSWGVVEANWTLAPFVVLLATFSSYVARLRPEECINGTSTKDGIQGLLTPEKIFVSLSLFNLLRVPLTNLPYIISLVVMAYVSIRRLGLFFMAEELNEDSVTRFGGSANLSGTALEFYDASFSWERNGPLVLKKLSFTIPRGSLVAVIGSVGSGKSSLLSACLGELYRRSGIAQQWATLAYTSQSAWIQHQSLRENILFGAPYDPVLYATVIEACQLEEDIQHLPEGDATEVGERGLTLSGGQKQRVALARAVYQQRDIYLLDDPLAAVDVHVGQRLFERVIGPRGVLKDRTRIFVTNAYHWLSSCDRILVLDKAKVAYFGTFRELKSSSAARFLFSMKYSEGSDLSTDTSSVDALETPAQIGDRFSYRSIPTDQETNPPFFRKYSSSWHSAPVKVTYASIMKRQGYSTAANSLPREELLPPVSCFQVDKSPLKKSFSPNLSPRSPATISQEVTESESLGSSSSEPTEEIIPVNAARLEDSAEELVIVNDANFRTTQQNEEDILQGRVSLQAYMAYIVARGIFLTLIAAIAYVVFAGIMAFSNKWLQDFADDKKLTAAGKILINPEANQSSRYEAAHALLSISNYYLGIYSWLGLFLTVCICVFVTVSVASSFKASKDLHGRMLSRVLHAPCYFFDTTPQGRILNRFSFDIDNIDHHLPHSITEVFSYVVDTIVTLVVVFITIRPWYFGLGSFVVFSTLYISIQMFYLPISRQSRRLNAITRSPLLAHCSETAASLLGASVVRAHGKVEDFVAAADRLIDNNALFVFIRSVSNRWLDFRLDMLNCVFLTFTAVLTVAMREEMPPGMAGFLISYVLAVPESLSWLVKMTAQMESSAVAIERVKEYMEIEQEAAWDSGPGSPPPPDWPSACCAVELIDATVKYVPQQRDDDNTTTTTTTGASVDLQTREKSIALRRVNLKLSGRPDERVVGIVGRTGAGKSTLAAALFRLVEAERDTSVLVEDSTDGTHADHRPGPIYVDHVDISKLGLHEVRSRFSILPQDPVLFTGTLRFNLDPFGVLGDADLWRALEKAHLGDWVHSLPAGLDHHCGESGSALSAGQKQLICLARVLLSCGGRVRLLVLDEATSAMDPNTDRLVMSTLLSDVFKDATILIIAHRLSTIRTADRIIVMSYGRVVESGRPDELLQDPNSLFSLMHAHTEEA